MKKKTTSYFTFFPNDVILLREHRQKIFKFLNSIRPFRDERGKDQANKIWNILDENLWIC